jgi:hypothetical protein
MRVMVMVKPYQSATAAGQMPSAEAVAEMGRYNDELIAAGVMVDGGGLKPPSAAGARIRWSGRKAMVLDGPFAETKEVIGGYWIWQVADFAEAVAWARKAPMEDTELELRPFFEPEDFAGIATPELIAQEVGWREEQLAKAPKAGQG